MKLNQYLVAASLLLSSVSVASIDLPHPTLKLSESRSLLPGRYVDFSENLDGYPYHDYVKANLKPTVYFQDFYNPFWNQTPQARQYWLYYVNNIWLDTHISDWELVAYFFDKNSKHAAVSSRYYRDPYRKQ